MSQPHVLQQLSQILHGQKVDGVIDFKDQAQAIISSVDGMQSGKPLPEINTDLMFLGVSASVDGNSLLASRAALLRKSSSWVETEMFIEKSLDLDTILRHHMDTLQEQNSLLILDPNNIEIEESLIGGQIFMAESMVVEARTKEDLAEIELEELEAILYEEAETDLRTEIDRENRIRQELKKSDAELVRRGPARDLRVTEVKMRVILDARFKQSRRDLLQLKRYRKLCETYASALKVKVNNLPAAAGLRNRGM